MTKYVIDLPDDVTCATYPMADPWGEHIALCRWKNKAVSVSERPDDRPGFCTLKRLSAYTEPLMSTISSQRDEIARLNERESVYRCVMASKDEQILDLLDRVEGRAG
jgi:hypothetical protein